MKLAFGLLLFFLTTPLLAGGWGFHLIAANEALKNYPSSPLKSLLLKHKVPFQNGILYPDGGYMTGEKALSEWSHEAHFVNKLMESLETEECHLRNTLACEEKLAFSLGVIVHIIEDIHFDKNFVKGLAVAEFGGNLDRAQSFTDVRFDTVILHHYKEFKKIPPFYEGGPFVLKIYQEKGFRVTEKDLLQMQVYQRVLYTALTAYSPHAAHRIALESPWATRNFISGPGGVKETAEEIQKIWLSFEEKNKKSPLLPRFKKTGDWPDQTFEIL